MSEAKGTDEQAREARETIVGELRDIEVNVQPERRIHVVCLAAALAKWPEPLAWTAMETAGLTGEEREYVIALAPAITAVMARPQAAADRRRGQR